MASKECVINVPTVDLVDAVVKIGNSSGAEIDKFEAFASFNGPDFYGLPRNTGKVTLQRQPWTLPEVLPFGEAQIKPLRGGETLSWRMS